MNWFPVLLVTHIALAVALLLPSVLLPFMLRRTSREPGRVTRALMAMQGTGTLGPELLTQPWLLTALILYVINLVIAAVVSRPNLRRLVGLGTSPTDDGSWARRARQQRYVAYGMAGLIGVIGFLMSTKPDLW
jgi:hypothetical protein